MSALDHTFAVIMAGGGGTRLWPVSRRCRPKQLIPLVEERTLFQTTVERLAGLFPPERILVITVAGQADQLRQQAPELPAENFLLEPVPRGTASVVGLAAVAALKRDPEAYLAILPSDHFIRNIDLFHHLMRLAVEVAERDYLVTLGVTPTYPSTAYGYIQRGEALDAEFAYPVYRVQRFVEKPEEPRARQMLAARDHSWNSGMFVWKAQVILEEMARYMPDLRQALTRIAEAWERPDREAVLAGVWHDLKVETIDYGVMEPAAQAGRAAVLPASGLDWSDIGNWDSLFDVLLPDEQGNIVHAGHHIPVETHNSLVYGNRDERLIVTIGVDDLIIVDAGDVLLICRRDQAQKVRQVVASLQKSGREQYL